MTDGAELRFTAVEEKVLCLLEVGGRVIGLPDGIAIRDVPVRGMPGALISMPITDADHHFIKLLWMHCSDVLGFKYNLYKITGVSEPKADESSE